MLKCCVKVVHHFKCYLPAVIFCQLSNPDIIHHSQMAFDMDTKGFSADFFQELITPTNPGVIIRNVTVSTGSGRGDNYTSMLYRVETEGETSDRNPWSKSFICKILPVNRARREAFKSESLFRNEVAFYTRALPALLAFQASKGISIFHHVPKVYLAKSHIIVLEDLKERGFKMLDRKEPLDFQHCEAILRLLGYFHGLSLALKQSSPKSFEREVTDQITECLFRDENEEWYSDYYQRAADNACNMLLEKLDGVKNENKYIDRFKHFMRKGFFRRMIAAMKPLEPLAVLCHGDCWTTNFLFSYSDSGGISDLCMLDFQFARYGSPALDIVYLLYICTTRCMREKHLTTLFKTYTGALTKTLSLCGCSLNILGNSNILKIIEEETRRCSQVGLGLAVDMIPICTCDSDQAPDLYLHEQNNEGERKNSNCQIPSTSEDGKTRISELVVELVDSSVI